MQPCGVERWDGYGAAPVDEVLGIFPDLAEGEDVVGLLCNLVESEKWNVSRVA